MAINVTQVEKILLRPKEVVEMIGVCRTRVYEMIAKGELPSIKIGKSVRVPTDGLHQWVAKQQQPS